MRGSKGKKYRAEVSVLHLLELGVGVASAQLHVAQHHLEDGVVDGLGEVHVELVHRRLQRAREEGGERDIVLEIIQKRD